MRVELKICSLMNCSLEEMLENEPWLWERLWSGMLGMVPVGILSWRSFGFTPFYSR